MKKLATLFLMILLSHYINAQNVLIFQPNSGLNDGTDSGTATSGKDTWVNRFAPNENYGTYRYGFSSPRSNCNTSDYKSYFQFDVSTLPLIVDSVFFGVTHIPHTTYCYSNCNADFYFYNVTSAWDEMTMIHSNEPSEEDTAFYGPLNITFPNDFKNKEYDITSAYLKWRTDGDNNFGFTTYSPTVGCNNAAVQFNVFSSDDTTAANRPYLKIYYPAQVGIKRTPKQTQIFTYPNPFKEILKIETLPNAKYFMSDMTGRVFNLSYESSIHGFNTSSFDNGMYILHVQMGQEHFYTKVYKLKD